jgi:hypothetical protein
MGDAGFLPMYPIIPHIFGPVFAMISERLYFRVFLSKSQKGNRANGLLKKCPHFRKQPACACGAGVLPA